MKKDEGGIFLNPMAPESAGVSGSGSTAYAEEIDKKSKFNVASMVPESMVLPGTNAGDKSKPVTSASYDKWADVLKSTDGIAQDVSNSHDVQLEIATAEIDADCTIINPEGMFRRVWDSVQIFLLAYVAICVPYRIGFGKEVAWLAAPWFWWDLLVDLYFITDLCISFRTAFYDNDGLLQYKTGSIVSHYLKSWFTIDVLSCLPVNYIGYLPSMHANSVESAEMKGNKLVRLLRLLRLLKLLRLARINRLIARYEQEYYALVSSLKIFKVILVVACVGHWLCCCWYAAGAQESAFDGPDGLPLQGWVARHFSGDSTASPITEYGVALYWAMMTMTTVGYGDIPPQTEWEYWFVTFAMLVGGFVFGMIVSFLGELSKDANPEESLRMRSSALLNAFVLKQERNPELTRRIRNFKAHHDGVQTAMDTLSIMQSLPWDMAHELATSIQWVDGYTQREFRRGILHQVPFCQGISELALITICSKLKHILARASQIQPESNPPVRENYIFKEGEVGTQFYVVMSGSIIIEANGTEDSAPFQVGKLKSGGFFGELAVLIPPEFKPLRQRSAYAEVESTLALLSYEDLRSLRGQNADINAAVLPFMEDVAAVHVPGGLTNLHRFPDQNGFLHDRVEGLERNIEKLLAHAGIK
jgi:hypothetical protein